MTQPPGWGGQPPIPPPGMGAGMDPRTKLVLLALLGAVVACGLAAALAASKDSGPPPPMIPMGTVAPTPIVSRAGLAQVFSMEDAGIVPHEAPALVAAALAHSAAAPGLDLLGYSRHLNDLGTALRNVPEPGRTMHRRAIRDALRVVVRRQDELESAVRAEVERQLRGPESPR